MISNPEPNVILPAGLQTKVDAARSNLAIIEETLKIKKAAVSSEEYTISQLVKKHEELDEQISSKSSELDTIQIDINARTEVLDGLNKNIEDAKNQLKEYREVIVDVMKEMTNREREVLAREQLAESKIKVLSEKEEELKNKEQELSNKQEALKVFVSNL